MNKAVIFDLDGTLLHTVPDITDNVNRMLIKFGYPEVSESDVATFVGNGAGKLVERCIGKPLTEDELKERLGYYNKIYTECGSPKTALFKGISEVLFTLKERGYKIAILTNKPQPTTERVYATYLSQFGFDMVVGSSDKVKCKPDKTATMQILKSLEVDPENAYFVGDGETDVMTAINSGTKGIAVLWGYRSKDALQKAGATVFVSPPSELLTIIKN